MSERDALVAQRLRQLNRDHYFASLVLPAHRRAPVQALWAFGAEVATISERVSEPGPGEIRLQWWADALAGDGHGDVRRNPVADALLDAIDAFHLPAGVLQRLLAARRFDLYQDPMPDLETFEGYAGEVNAILFQGAAMIVNDGRPVEPGDAAGHLGVAEALIGHFTAFGFNAARGRIFLPMSVFAAHGVSEGQIFTGKTSDPLREALTQVAELAQSHLARAEVAIAILPRPLRPAFAMLAPLKKQHDAMLKTLADPFGPFQAMADWRKLGALWAWTMAQQLRS